MTGADAGKGGLHVALTPLGQMVAEQMRAHEQAKAARRARVIAGVWRLLRILGVRHG